MPMCSIVQDLERNATESDTSSDEFEVDPPVGLKAPQERVQAVEELLETLRRNPQNVLIDLDDGDPFHFMILDIESIVSNGSDYTDISSNIIRIFGISENGCSVSVSVHNFKSYFYVSTSIPFVDDVEIKLFEGLLRKTVHRELIRDIHPDPKEYQYSSIEPILNVSRVDEKNCHVFDYNHKHTGDKQQFLKISCSLPKFVWIASKVLNDGQVVYPIASETPCQFEVFEGQLCNVIRFMTDKNLRGCTWIQIDGGNYTIIPENYWEKNQSHCQIELKVDDPDCIKVLHRMDKIPEIRVFCFDIEAMVRPCNNYSIPFQGTDRILQISTVISNYPTTEPFARVVFALGECNPIPDAHIFSFTSEVEMLDCFRHFLIQIDPDIISGHNVINFDFPMLLARAKVLQMKDFHYLGRVKCHPTSILKYRNSPKRISPYYTAEIKIHGRIVFDTLQLFKRHNYVSFPLSLQSLAQRLLGDTKDNVSYKDIFKLQNLSNESRTILAKYCLKDSELVLKLLHTNVPGRDLDFITYYIFKSRNCGAPLRHLIHKSDEYNHWVMSIWKQKNPEVKLGPVTPLKKHRMGPSAPKKSHQKLFHPYDTGGPHRVNKDKDKDNEDQVCSLQFDSLVSE